MQTRSVLETRGAPEYGSGYLLLLVDGTFISGTSDFYGMVHQVFEAAKDNAPSVIFIDDSDVIFESGQEHGLYRYLLTMLDGLESESQSQFDEPDDND